MSFLFPSLTMIGQRHHKEDIIVGSLIGFGCAYLTYTIYWEHPFSSRLVESGVAAQPRLVYDSHSANVSAEDYELAPGSYEDGEEVDLEAQPPREGRSSCIHSVTE